MTSHTSSWSRPAGVLLRVALGLALNAGWLWLLWRSQADSQSAGEHPGTFSNWWCLAGAALYVGVLLQVPSWLLRRRTAWVLFLPLLLCWLLLPLSYAVTESTLERSVLERTPATVEAVEQYDDGSMRVSLTDGSGRPFVAYYVHHPAKNRPTPSPQTLFPRGEKVVALVDPAGRVYSRFAMAPRSSLDADLERLFAVGLVGLVMVVEGAVICMFLPERRQPPEFPGGSS